MTPAPLPVAWRVPLGRVQAIWRRYQPDDTLLPTFLAVPSAARRAALLTRAAHLTQQAEAPGVAPDSALSLLAGAAVIVWVLDDFDGEAPDRLAVSAQHALDLDLYLCTGMLSPALRALSEAFWPSGAQA